MPTTYQALPDGGPEPELLLADHADVLGHHEGMLETLFKSDADFRSAELTTLWRAIADHIRLNSAECQRAA